MRNKAQNITVTDTLDANTTYVSFKAPKDWTCSADSGVVTCAGARLESGSSANIAIHVTVMKKVPLNTTLSNTAVVTSDTYDPDPASNTATQMTLVSK